MPLTDEGPYVEDDRMEGRAEGRAVEELRRVGYVALDRIVFLLVSIEPLSLGCSAVRFESVLRVLANNFLGSVGEGLASFRVICYRESIQSGILQTTPKAVTALRAAFSFGTCSNGQTIRVTVRDCSVALPALAYSLSNLEQEKGTYFTVF